MTSKLYYDPSKPSAFSSLKKLQTAAAKEIGKKPGEIKSWLEKQDAYTLHRPLRKRFPRNPYTVNNIIPLTTRRVHWTRRKILICIILIITFPRQAVLNEFVKYSCCNIYISLGWSNCNTIGRV